GWRIPPEKTVEIAKLAIETGLWPLFEIENGDFHNIKFQRFPKDGKFKKPIEDYLRLQGRFKHLFKKPEAIQELKNQIKELWRILGKEVELP
ncbi:MAG TPA: pyruvate ferredoxin oxidoreductase, partial [Thermococcus litoralis]|nr:pyruvate ferredoxin oxidoreductase [Thermococcus litoralis]